MTAFYLHAVGLDGTLWRGVARAGARTPDLPGHGRAPALAGDVTMAALVEHVAGLIEESGGGPADLIGISLGSMVSQEVAVHRPDLVRSLVLACGGMRTDPAVSRQRAADTRSAGMSGTLDVTLRRWFTEAALTDPDHPGVARARARLLADDPAVIADYWAAMAGHDLSGGALGAVTVPTTCIGATSDASVPVAAMRAVADAIPGARMVEIPGPHIVVLEEPAGFVAAVDEHFAWVGQQVGAR